MGNLEATILNKVWENALPYSINIVVGGLLRARQIHWGIGDASSLFEVQLSPGDILRRDIEIPNKNTGMTMGGTIA